MLADVNDLQRQVAEKKQDLDDAERIAAKMQEKADETRLVQQWLGDQVDWLGQLQRLSSRFPEGQLANVRRLSASVDGSTGGIDLSVQVNDLNRFAELENALREANFAITSKRISEQANNEEYPWQFEARIAFPITPLDERGEETFVQSTTIEPIKPALPTPSLPTPNVPAPEDRESQPASVDDPDTLDESISVDEPEQALPEASL